MKTMKYICLVLMIIGTSARAWAVTETMDFTKCWGIGTSAYESGEYTYGGYAIYAHDAKYNSYNDYWVLNYLSSGDHNAYGGLILPPFDGTVSSITVTAGSGSGSTPRNIALYVDGELQTNSTGIAASGSYTFSSLSIPAGSTVELRNSTTNDEFHLARIAIVHNGTQMGGTSAAAHGKISAYADGNGTISIATNPIANDASTTMTATAADGWTFVNWEVKSVQGKCESWQYYQTESVTPNANSATVTLTNSSYADEFIAIAHFEETTCTIETKVVFAKSGAQNVNASSSAQTFDNAGTAKRDDNNNNTGQTVSYSSSNPTISVNGSGRVSIPAGFIGSVTITATARENGDYCESSASYTLNVNGYTVTYHYPTSCSASTPADVGAPGVIGSHSLPTNMGVDGYQFVGWTTNSSFADGDSAPSTLYTSSVTVTANIDLYAVYRKVSSKFVKMAANTTLTAGDYVICTNYTGTAVVMTNELDGNYRMTTNGSDYTFDGDGNLSCNDEECIWNISGSAGNWVLYNAASSKYLSANNGSTGSSDRQMRLADNSSTNFEKWIIAQKDAGTVPYQIRNKGRVAANSSDYGINVNNGKIGWLNGQTGSFYLFKRTSTANAYTINPSCTAAEYTVTFNLSSAPAGSSVTASATGATFSSPVLSPVLSGASVTIGATAGTGYQFDHWTVTSGGASLNSAATVASNRFTMPASNVVLTPVFAPKDYTITYLDKGGGEFSGTHDVGYPTTHTYGTATTLSGATKTDWEFAGWYTTKACTAGTQVTTLGATDYTKAITLYALWVHFTDPLAWCPEPELLIDGTTYITSLYHADDGGMVRGSAQLSITGRNMGINEDVTITSNNAAVYFSLSNADNIKKAAANQPKTSLTLKTDANGKLNGDAGYTIYVHFMPSAAGDGSISDVTVTATYAVSDPEEVSTTHVYVRSMPTQFVIATKVGSTWYALPANMSAAGNPDPVQIDVNETSWTAKGPSTVAYAMWPVKTVNGSCSYTANGDHLRFVGNDNKALWASGTANTYTIRNYAAVTAVGDNVTTSYEWQITTTPLDALDPTSGTWKYNIQSHQTNNTKYLNIKNNDIVWGTYNDGYQLTNEMYLLPLTVVTPLEYSVIEWYPTKMLIQTDATLSSPTITINGETVASPTITAKGSKWYEIGNLPLESNPAAPLTITNSGASCTKTIPVIISRGTKTISETPFTTLGKAVYNHTDLVVRDGAVLTVNGSETDNTFHDVTIHSNSKISIPAKNTNNANNFFGVHSLTFFGGIDEIYDGTTYTVNKYSVPQLSLKGKFGTKTVTEIDYVMRVDDRQMYSLTVPYDVDLADITYWDGASMGTLGDKLWVSAYDGQARANQKLNQTWIWEVNFESKGLETKLKQGVGYTISADYQYSGNPYAIIRMPMKSNVGANATELAKTVAVVAYDNNQGETVSANHKGWNLVGNPYMVAISGETGDSKLVVGSLSEHNVDGNWDGTYEWKADGYRYVTIPFDNGTDYYQRKFSEVTLPPFKNFFVQVATSGDMAFDLANRQNSPGRHTSLMASDREVEFEIVLDNGERTDQTGLLIGDNYTSEYEINADLEKMTGTMSVYTIYGGYKLAYAAMSPSDAALYIPVGYIADKAGDYTFRLAEDVNKDEFEHIWLSDYEENMTVDLLEEDYTFGTAKGKNESRFALSTILKTSQETPTSMEQLGNLNADGPMKFIWQDKMYILLDGVIYDAVGKKVMEINK